MKLFDLFKRKKKGDDDEADSFDDDRPRTQVIDDDTELSELSADSGDVILDSEIEDMTSPSAEGVGTEHSGDDEMIGGDELEIPDFGNEDELDFGDDGDDGDDDEEAEGRNPMLFVFAGVLVLFVGVIGGAGFWFLGSDDEPVADKSAELQSSDTSVSMALAPKNPQKGGGLNAIGIGGLAPPPAEGGQVTDDQSSAQSAVDATNTEPANSAPTNTQPDPDADTPAQAPTLTPEQRKVAALATITGVGEGLSLNATAVSIPRDTGQGLVIPSVTSVSYQSLPDQNRVVPLATAPDENLIEQVAGLENPLPIIGKDGRQPWQVYSRPFIQQTANPKIAIIVKGLGFSRAASMAAIKKLPGEVTLAFSPYVRDLNDWMLRARLSGHEVLLELPLESKNFPSEDAGPLALSTGLQVADNIQQLNNVMSRMTGYIGLLSVMGSKFNEAEGQLKPILNEVKRRGLFFVDGGGAKSRARRIAAEIGLPKAFSNVYLDRPPSRRAMDQKLQGLERLVREQAAAVAIIHAYPNTIERILIWIRTLEQRNLTLVPVSALADKQFIQ